VLGPTQVHSEFNVSTYCVHRLLQHNNISIIGNKEFNQPDGSGARGIEFLDLSYCGIREIRGTPFNHLPELRTLRLTNNFLTDGSFRKAFKSHRNLQRITLSGNLLTK
jgi:Leucine-rich repeat (LRR) protein